MNRNICRVLTAVTRFQPASLSCAHFFPFCLFFLLFRSLQFIGFAVRTLFCFGFVTVSTFSTLFYVMSVVPACPVFSYSSFSLLVSELQSPSTQLCVLKHGVKLTRNAAREHFREQKSSYFPSAVSMLTAGAKKVEAARTKEHIAKSMACMGQFLNSVIRQVSMRF